MRDNRALRMICQHNFPYYDCRICSQYSHESTLEGIHYGYIDKLIKAHKYSEVRAYLSQNSFPCHMWPRLQKIWHESYYFEFEGRGKELKAVAKFRLRKKFPPPMTIWNGEKLSYNLPQKTREYLEAFFAKNEFASTEEKEEIASILGMTESQVSNWFKNKRQRKRTNERKGHKVHRPFDSNFGLHEATNNYVSGDNYESFDGYSSGQFGSQGIFPPSYQPDYYYDHKREGRDFQSYLNENMYNNSVWSQGYSANYYGGVDDSFGHYRPPEVFGDYYYPKQYAEEYKENIPHYRENGYYGGNRHHSDEDQSILFRESNL